MVPTALGGALAVIGAKQNPTVADWTAALEQANDTPAVNTALLEILTSPRYQQIITALRTPQPLLNQDLSPVTYADKDHTPVILDNVATVRGLVWNNADMLSTPWTGGPPHPKGDDLLALVKLLSGYKQSA